MATDWYFARNDEQRGPHSSAELKELAAIGDLRPTDLVWREGMPEWVPANKVKGLFAESVPPPVPRHSPRPEIPVRIVNEPTPNKSNGLIVAGYVCAGLSLLLLPPALGLAGIICGIINLTRGQTGHGLAQIILSVTCGIFGLIIGAAMMS
jgi:hypothetical protein